MIRLRDEKVKLRSLYLSSHEVIQRRQSIVQLEEVRSTPHGAVRLPAGPIRCKASYGDP